MFKFKIQNRRYTGSKFKLIDWIVEETSKEVKRFESFFDIFSGTGCVASRYVNKKKLIINDFLFSNNIIYNAFFNSKKFSKNKLFQIAKKFNQTDPAKIPDNYFSNNFGNKFFSKKDARIIGYLREAIQKEDCTKTDKNILLASLLYSADKCANTVGHYDAYRKKVKIEDKFLFGLIEPMNVQANVSIFREDANVLAKKIKSDVVYIDPPYNSRQYSRFYHVLENLTKWNRPKLFGEALKPMPENISEYCKTNAVNKFKELVFDLDCNALIVSYNNTYNSNSSSSKNKITLEQIEKILKSIGKTKILKKKHAHFNAGKTNFEGHQEFLFITLK